MNKPLIIALIALVLLVAAAALVVSFLTPDLSATSRTASSNVAAARPRPSATPPRQGQPLATPTRGPSTGFTGVFSGTLQSSDGSSAPGILEFEQDGNEVTGTFTIEPGLYIDGGRCGQAEVPPGTESATGTIDKKDKNKMVAVVEIEQSGIKVKITLEAQLSKDQKTLTGKAVADLPFLCGTDPVITGVFARQ